MPLLSPFELQRILTSAVSVALKASKPVMEIYHTDFSVEFKADSSPVTKADLLANELIKAGLQDIGVMSNSPAPVLAEESGAVPYSNRKDWNPYWLVDPLDGTKEFVSKNGEFTINIALIADNAPLAGVVFAPVLKLLYFGSSLLGAYKLAINSVEQFVDSVTSFDALIARAERLSSATEQRYRREEDSQIIVIGSRSHRSAEFEGYIQELSKSYDNIEILSAGSSLKFCRVAEGSADFYPRFGPTVEWDTAAGHAIVNAVGKKVLVHDKDQELSYNKEDLINPWFIVR